MTTRVLICLIAFGFVALVYSDCSRRQTQSLEASFRRTAPLRAQNDLTSLRTQLRLYASLHLLSVRAPRAGGRPGYHPILLRPRVGRAQESQQATLPPILLIFPHLALKGSCQTVLHCAHRTSTVSSCAFCEQEGWSGSSPSPLTEIPPFWL